MIGRMRLALVAFLLSACAVKEKYLVAPESLAAIASLPPSSREHVTVPARRAKDGHLADVRASSLSPTEVQPQADGSLAVISRQRTKRLVMANAFVWAATPISIAGTLMIILGRGAVRWSGVAMAGVAEPFLDVGTAFWVRGAMAHPQELPRGLPDITYLPDPKQPALQGQPALPAH